MSGSQDDGIRNDGSATTVGAQVQKRGLVVVIFNFNGFSSYNPPVQHGYVGVRERSASYEGDEANQQYHNQYQAMHFAYLCP